MSPFRHLLIFAAIFNVAYTAYHQRDPPRPTKPPKSLRQMLLEEKIIPEIIPNCTDEICDVYYNGHKLITGQHLPAVFSKRSPFVRWKAQNDTYYTLYLCASNRFLNEEYRTLDPAREGLDYPRLIEWEAWIVMNILGNDIKNAHTLTNYLCAGYPIREEYLDRYVFLIYKQPGKLKNYNILEEPNPLPTSFKVTDFVKLHNLTGPIANNYFTIKWDDSFKATMSSVRWIWQLTLKASPHLAYPRTPVTLSDEDKKYLTAGPRIRAYFSRVEQARRSGGVYVCPHNRERPK